MGQRGVFEGKRDHLVREMLRKKLKLMNIGTGVPPLQTQRGALCRYYIILYIYIIYIKGRALEASKGAFREVFGQRNIGKYRLTVVPKFFEEF
jgi:hypothetical protein